MLVLELITVDLCQDTRFSSLEGNITMTSGLAFRKQHKTGVAVNQSHVPEDCSYLFLFLNQDSLELFNLVEK